MWATLPGLARGVTTERMGADLAEVGAWSSRLLSGVGCRLGAIDCIQTDVLSGLAVGIEGDRGAVTVR